MIAQRSGRGDQRHRSLVSLGADLEKRLSAYAGAAVAAGVGLLALARSAEAKIVYTPAHTKIPVNGGPVALDLNHDGTADFSFSNRFRTWSVRDPRPLDGAAGVLAVSGGGGNAVWGRGTISWSFSKNGVFASALRSGFRVGPDKSFFQNRSRWLMAYSGVGASIGGTGFGSLGQWLNTRDRYLGLKFLTKGQVHYGWARFNVGLPPWGQPITAKLTGYAYETIANKPIIAGKTNGPDVVVFEPASLGRLAQGSPGISAWRKP